MKFDFLSIDFLEQTIITTVDLSNGTKHGFLEGFSNFRVLHYFNNLTLLHST